MKKVRFRLLVLQSLPWLALWGCHLLVPYESEPGLEGGPVMDGAPRDGKVQPDLPVKKDTKPKPDLKDHGTVKDGTKKDHGKVIDGSLKDKKPVKKDWLVVKKDGVIAKDLPGACGEVQDIKENAKSCTDQCLPANKPSDADGDGLPDSMDPQSSCNRLLFSDGFVYGTSSTAWNWTNSGTVVHKCGWGGLKAGASITLKSATAAAKLTTNKYLVQARFSVTGALTGAWKVQLTEASGASPHYRCSLGVWSGGWQPKPGLRHFRSLTGSCASMTCYTYKCNTKGKDTTVTSGDIFYLQSYHDGKNHTCRLLSSTGTVLLTHKWSNKGCPPDKPGTVKLLATNVEVAVDHLRVFEMKSN